MEASVAQAELTIEALRAALEVHEHGNVDLFVSSELQERAEECAEGFGRVTVRVSPDLEEGGWQVQPEGAALGAEVEAGQDVDFGGELARDPLWDEEEWAYQQRKHREKREAAAARDLAAEQVELDADDKPEELRQEAGDPVGPMPPAEPEENTIPPDQILVAGTQKRPGKWAGKAPSTVVVALKGVKFEVDGSFKKGDRFKFEGEALITSEGVKDKLDKETRTVSEAVQSHDATVLDFATTE